MNFENFWTSAEDAYIRREEFQAEWRDIYQQEEARKLRNAGIRLFVAAVAVTAFFGLVITRLPL